MKNLHLLKCLSNTLLSKKVVKPILAMSSLHSKVFVKNVDAEERLKICFLFGTPELPEKTFIFDRMKEEKLETTLSRMKIKIVEAIASKISPRKKKRTSSSITADIPLSMSLYKKGNKLDEEIKNIDAWVEDNVLQINDIVYEIIKNPPAVSQLSLPKSIMAGFLVYPRLELEYSTKDQCCLTWYRVINKSIKKSFNFDESKIVKVKNEFLLKLSNEFFYITTDADVGFKLKFSCIPSCGDKKGLEEVAVTEKPVQEKLHSFPFEERHKFTIEMTPANRIRCVSYNILADLYAGTDVAHNELFPYCPTDALKIDYRKQLYLKEIIGYNADILCLQEVDRKIFFADLVPVLTSAGLEGIYSEKGGTVVEGLSCFYRSSKFNLIAQHSVILSDVVSSDPVLQPILSKLEENEKLKERFMNRTTALQAVLLESKDDPNKRILVGNTHLYFHPESDNIRLIQATSCIWYLESLRNKYQSECPSLAVLLCGDFNSCPEFAVYNFFTTGSLDKDRADWRSNPEEAVPGMDLQHSLQLSSACGTPAYTNFTAGFVGCLDYIFYDTSRLRVHDVVPFPDHEHVTRHTGLPSELFPSDHIALVSTLEWKQ